MDHYTQLRFSRDGLTFAAYQSSNDGPALLFQHGLCGDSAQTADVMPANLAHRHYAIDCRGHGGSEPGPVAQFTIATFTNDVIAFIERHVEAPCIIGGISMGAAISLRLAVKRPDLVSGLILARPAWFTEAGPPNLEPNAEVGQLLASHSAVVARQKFLESPTAVMLRDIAPDNLVSLTNMFERTPQRVTAELLTRIPADGPGVSIANIAALKLPVLVLATGEDFVHPVLLADNLAATIPGAKRVVITSKSVDAAAYTREFRSALQDFLKDYC